MENAVLAADRLEIVPEDVLCCCVPVAHCFGLVCGLLMPMVSGITTVLPSDVFIADSTLQTISDHGCTVMHGVSAMFLAMLDHPDANDYLPNIRLRTGIIAGSAIPGDLLKTLQSNYGFSGLAYAYGMTELSCLVFLTSPSIKSLTEGPTSVGLPMPNTSVKIVDPELKIVPADTVGELLVSGYLVFQGYYKNPVKTKEAVVHDQDGRAWLRTGDLAKIDSAGRCTIIGRVKDMIKRGETYTLTVEHRHMRI